MGTANWLTLAVPLADLRLACRASRADGFLDCTEVVHKKVAPVL